MTDYANKDLCKELYEATGWADDSWWYSQANDRTGLLAIQPQEYLVDVVVNDNHSTYPYLNKRLHPAYTIGYLLNKLPKNLMETRLKTNLFLTLGWNGDSYSANYDLVGDEVEYEAQADTPADALCKLALALHKDGLL